MLLFLCTDSVLIHLAPGFDYLVLVEKALHHVPSSYRSTPSISYIIYYILYVKCYICCMLYIYMLYVIYYFVYYVIYLLYIIL